MINLILPQKCVPDYKKYFKNNIVSESVITACTKIENTLVVYIFSNV